MSIGAPVPARVDAATKQALLGLLAHAVGQGWPVVKACRVLGLDVRRARRWAHRADTDTNTGLVDARPGGSVNALMPDEVEAIVAAFETYGVRTSPTAGWRTAAPMRACSGPGHPRYGGS